MSVVVKSYSNPSNEMMGIADEIHRLIHPDHVNPSEIAVIFRENKYLDEMTAYLQDKGIPFRLVKKENLLRSTYIQQVILIFEWIALEASRPGSGDHQLFKLLHFRWFDLPAALIARLQMEFNKQMVGGVTSFRHFLLKLITQPNAAFSPDEINRLKRVTDLLEKWLQDVYNEPLQQFFCRVLGESHILQQAVMGDYFQLHLLKTLFDFLQSENQRNPDLTLTGWIEIIHKMQKYGLSIPYETRIGDEHAVQLLTAHGAKGLEFDYVFIGGCVEKNWEKNRGRSIIFTLPPALKNAISGQTGTTSRVEDERRLFYVALTRARKHVEMSYARMDEQNNSLKKSIFLNEIGIPEIQGTSQSNIQTVIANQLQGYGLVDVQTRYDQALLQQWVKNFVLNPTALNKYLYCPRSFFYESLLQVPQAEQMHSVYGQAIHHALKQAAHRHQQGQGLNHHQRAIADFTWFMGQNRHHFTPDDFNRHIGYGEKVLQDYFKQVLPQWGVATAIEKNYQAQINGIPIKGRLDKIETDQKTIRVVDYKTSKPDNAGDKLKPYNQQRGKKEKDDYDYWIQAVMYALLLQANGQPVGEIKFDFVEPDKNGQFQSHSIKVTQGDIDLLTQLIEDTWQKIQALDFPCCAHKDCPWCAFEQSLANGGPGLQTHDEPAEPISA